MNQTFQTTIRPVEIRDLAFTRNARSDGELRRSILGRPFPITEYNERLWFESLGVGAFPNHAVWIIADQLGCSVGLTQLTDIHWIHRTARFGIWISPEYRGRSHAARGLELVCDFGFSDCGE